jgi:hypothetical protein
MNKKNNEPCTPCVKKRGRKSKKELEELALQKASISISSPSISSHNSNDNINVLIEESNNETETENETNNNTPNNSTNNILNLDDDNENVSNVELSLTNIHNCDEDKPVAKKRGRKPKGGKIIQQIVPLNNNKEPKPNVILHLKCSLKDLQSNLIQGSEIQSFNFQPTNQLTYDIINSEPKIFNKQEPPKIVYDEPDYDDDDDRSVKENDTKEVWKKLKILEHNLHINNISDKKSACFWCTHEFDNPPVYIPKHFVKDSYHVYGCFCSPECGTAYLMEENIDSSSKFERYYLINHIYSKIYDYKKNIKPAPNPYYMLEKYYGNLTIQEYRSLLRNERLFLVVDKPLTRILPELHEDNDDFIINNKIIPLNNYQFKRKLQKKQTKNNILSERFGLA